MLYTKYLHCNSCRLYFFRLFWIILGLIFLELAYVVIKLSCTIEILLSVTSRDHGEVLADALKTLLWEGKQQDMLRAAAFIKRLATFALSFGSAEAIAGLFCSSQLLVFVCPILFELMPAELL
jgi:nucleolar complex protein 3